MATSLALGPSEPLRVLRQHCVVCKYQDLTTAGRSRKCEWLVFWNDQSLSFYRRARSLDNCQLFVGAFVFLLGVWFWLSCSSFCPEVTPHALSGVGNPASNLAACAMSMLTEECSNLRFVLTPDITHTEIQQFCVAVLEASHVLQCKRRRASPT